MSLPTILDDDQLDFFFHTMYERQMIWYRRFVLKLPCDQWTSNEIFAKYHFTNVYRELDRTSQWILRNIILNTNIWHKYDNDLDNYLNLVWKILFARTINNPNVLTSPKIIHDYGNYNPDDFYDYLKTNIVDLGVPFAHGAFQQTSYHDIKDANGNWLHFANMPEFFAKCTLVSLHNHIKDIYDFMQHSFTNEKTADEFLTFLANSLMGARGFMAHEFFQDLCYIKAYTGLELMSWNANSATNAGPGSCSGSHYIFNELPVDKDAWKKASTRKQVLEVIKWLYSIAEEKLQAIHNKYYPETDGFYYIAWDKDNNQYKRVGFNLTLNQIEMWLCEFSKYHKIAKVINENIRAKTRYYKGGKPNDALMY